MQESTSQGVPALLKQGQRTVDTSKANGFMSLAKNVIVEAERMFFIHSMLRPLLVVQPGPEQIDCYSINSLKVHANMKVYYLYRQLPI